MRCGPLALVQRADRWSSAAMDTTSPVEAGRTAADDGSTIVWFDALGAADVAAVGGKGANLGELTRAGLPVPPGFVVIAAGFLAGMDAAGVRDELRHVFEDALARAED